MGNSASSPAQYNIRSAMPGTGPRRAGLIDNSQYEALFVLSDWLSLVYWG